MKLGVQQRFAVVHPRVRNLVMALPPRGPFEPIEHDLGPAVAAVWALYEGTFRDACVMDRTQEQATMELTPSCAPS